MAGVPVHVGPDAVEVMSPGSATETSAEAPLTTLDTIIKQVLPSTLVSKPIVCLRWKLLGTFQQQMQLQRFPFVRHTPPQHRLDECPHGGFSPQTCDSSGGERTRSGLVA